MIDINNKKLIYEVKNVGINYLEKLNLLEIFVKEILINQVIKDIFLSDQQISDFLKDFNFKNNIGDIDELNKFLLSKNISKELFIEKLIRVKKINLFSKENFKSKARNYFLKNKNLFDKATYTLIRLIDYELAKELYLQIEGGEENINDLAAKYSLGEEKNSKGVIGPVSINQGHPLLREKLLSYNEGELIEPFKIDKTWIILKIEKFIKVDFNDQIEFKLCNEFFEKFISEKSKIIIKELRSI